LASNLNTSSLISVDQQLVRLEKVFKEVESYLEIQRPAFIPTHVYGAVQQMAEHIPELRKQVGLMEHEWRSLRALAQMGQVVNSSIELEEVLQIVMDTIIRLTGAERGFLMLKDAEGELAVQVARNWEQATLHRNEFAFSRTVINQVISDGQPVLTTNAQDDPRFEGQESIVLHNLRSILCVPLIIKHDRIGVIYADNRVRSGLFTRRHLELLTGFGNQAATAIENARLFTSVRKTLAEVTELKNLMDHVFASIPSGVLTMDCDERILLCNRAAGQILGKTGESIAGMKLGDALAPLAAVIARPVKLALQQGDMVKGIDIVADLPARGAVDLRVSVAPMIDETGITQGVAMVVEDLTETKRLQAQRSLFERMVSPAVIQGLNPTSLRLGGQRRTITTLFADIRGFTSYSEIVEPEQLVAVLNRYLAGAAEAVLDQDGTIDKFLGDAVMAWFNAPVPQSDHAVRAVRAAVAVRESVLRLNRQMPDRDRLSFGIGIHTGEAVLGLVGTEKRLDYTAIGDAVNTAKRIEENAQAGQILLSSETCALLGGMFEVLPARTIQVEGKREPLQVYELTGLAAPV
jgi:PAS domain S-box-containing protein